MTCSNSTYSISGLLSGLGSGKQVTLQNNAGNPTTVNANGSFTFSTPVAYNSSYAVTVGTQPTGQICTVSNGTGSGVVANVSNVGVTCGQAWTGTKQVGIAGGDTRAAGVATDSNGNVYITGWTNGSLDGNTRTGSTEFLFAKYDSSGNKLFIKQHGTDETLGAGIATDSNGNVYITGLTSSGLDGNTRTGTYDFFVAKYDSSGNKLFIKQFGATGTETRGSGVATDSNGNVYITGRTKGGLDGNTRTGTIDFFIAKYDSSGNKLFIKQLGAAGTETVGTGVATDRNGNVFITGNTSGGLDGNIQAGYSAFVAKYDSSGNKLFIKQVGINSTSTEGAGIATDSNGNVYISGSTNADLDGNTRTGTIDFFIAKYDSSGNKLFIKQLGTAGAQTEGASIAIDSNGNVFITGYTGGGLDGNTRTGTTDFFVTKYDSIGNKQYTRQLGTTAGNWSWATGIATDSNDNVFITGKTSGSLDGNTIAGVADFFVTKYDSNGVKQ